MESTPITQDRLTALAERLPVSGNSAGGLLPYYEIDSRYDVEGQKTLDICAGGSDLTAALLSMGADAYALDLGYKDPKTLIQRLKDGFSANHLAPSDSRSHLAVESGSQVENPSHLIEPSHRAMDVGVLNMNFIDSIDGYPERYKAGSATSLPFPDKSFDRIFSFYGIFGVLDEEADLLQASIEEAIRVLKDTGEIQIGPLLGGDISEKGLQNQRDLLEKLKDRPDLRISASEELFPGERVGGGRQLRKFKISKVPQDK